MDVAVTLYRWAGSWGPIKIKVPCGECTLTRDILEDTLENELSGIVVDLVVKDWLNCWWEPLLAGGWHAPVVMVDGRVISQGKALNRGLLTEAVVAAHVKHRALAGNQLFGKKNCPYCRQAKELLHAAGIEYAYHDVVSSPRALYEMLARVKPHVGVKDTIRVPQIWIDGNYIGGSNELRLFLAES